METTALILSIILFIIVGLLGTILPILPGVGLIYGGMLLYGYMTNFATLDANFFLSQGLVLAFIFSVDFLASAVGTRRFNGSNQAAGGAILGTILGLLFLGPLGIIIGPFLGAVAAELVRGIPLKQSVLVGFGTLVGTLVGILGGTILKLCAEVIMIVYFFMRIYNLYTKLNRSLLTKVFNVSNLSFLKTECLSLILF